MNLKNAPAENFGPVKTFFYRLWAEPSIAPMHRRIASEVPIDDGRLLDLGCGGGKVAHRIAADRPRLHVVGIDSSEAMIRDARRRWSLPNLEFRLGTVELCASAGEFDFAITVLSFHHWEEPEATLTAVHGALRSGGRFWIYEMDPEAEAAAIRGDRAALWGFLRLPIALQRRMARDHGFTESEVEELVRPVVARTPFRDLSVSRAGSTVRLELACA